MTELLLAFVLLQPPLPHYPPPGPGFPPYQPQPTLVAQPEGFCPERPIGVQTFAKSFVPTPGVHHVWFLHPKTKRAVYVTFILPDGCVCLKVKSGSRYVRFDYRGHRDVEVNFKHNGGVEVEY